MDQETDDLWIWATVETFDELQANPELHPSRGAVFQQLMELCDTEFDDAWAKLSYKMRELPALSNPPPLSIEALRDFIYKQAVEACDTRLTDEIEAAVLCWEDRQPGRWVDVDARFSCGCHWAHRGDKPTNSIGRPAISQLRRKPKA